MKAKILIIACFTLIFKLGYSQADDGDTLDNQLLIIYNEFSPVLKDASRLQYLPVVVDTVKVITKFSYDVKPVMYQTEFFPAPLSVASVKGESLKPLDNGMVKLGIGNYWVPYIEAFYNNKRERNYSFGAYAKHHSSHGKTKNSEGQKVYNGFANSIVNGFGKLFLPASTLYGDAAFSSDIVNFYGYDPLYLKGNMPHNIVIPRVRSDMESINYMRLKINGGIVSNNLNKNRFDYKLNFAYQYFFTSEKDNQNKIKVDADINRTFNLHRFGMDAKLEFNRNKIKAVNSYNETFLDLNPYYKLYSNNWQIVLGVNTTGEFKTGSVNYHFYPNVYVQHNISNTLIPYFAFKGFLENNNLEYLSRINPFINNDFYNYEVTNHAQAFDLGLKGNISRDLFFHINANYSKIDNMAFFVNDTSTLLNNKFFVEYANVERFSGYGEIALKDFKKFSFTLKGHYYFYSYIKGEEKPWHMPKFDIGLETCYQYNSKLKFGVDVDVISKRYAKEYHLFIGGYDYIKQWLKPIVDVSLFGEYSFASNFDCFLYLNNITGQKQYYWNNYHSLGFNALLGLKYLF